MHLTQSSHAALTKAAETWNRERAGQAPDGVVLHQISANDTLQGLAIQYGATQQVRGVWVCGERGLPLRPLFAPAFLVRALSLLCCLR